MYPYGYGYNTLAALPSPTLLQVPGGGDPHVRAAVRVHRTRRAIQHLKRGASQPHERIA